MLPGLIRFLRIAAATIIGGGTAIVQGEPSALLLTPLLSGIFKAWRASYRNTGKIPPWWTGLF